MRSTRRQFLAAASAGMALGNARLSGGAEENLPPVRAITRGPGFHWFSYYDKLQFDPTGRYALGMEIGCEHRLPESNDAVRIGMVDLAEGDRWIELGTSQALVLAARLHVAVAARIDSPHGGNGRQIYLIEIAGIVG
jgi:hypothetical protein